MRKMENHHRYVNILGHKMHYLAYGKGQAIVFIHGFGTDSYSWRNNISTLSRHFRLYLPDLIGFGDSDKPETNYSRPFFIKQIYQFLKLLKIKKTTLAGASWGANLALSFTIEFPAKVNKLIIINAMTPFHTRKLSNARKRRLKALTAVNQGKMSFKSGRKVLEKLLKESYYSKRAVTDKVVSQQFKMWKTQKGRNALMAVSAQCKFNDILSKNGTINKKTLIVWGDKDPYFPIKSAKWLQGKIKGSELIMVSDAGHAAHETHPDIVNQTILNFLRS